MSTVSEQIKHLPHEIGQPLAAVNGDFYNKHDDYPGDPRDLQISEGEVVSSPSGHACFWVDAANNPHMTNVVSRFRVVWPNGTTTAFGVNEERPGDGAVLYSSALGKSTRTSGGLELILEATTNSSRLPVRVSQILHKRV